MQDVARKPVEQGCQEGPVGGSEPDLVTVAVELLFEDRDLLGRTGAELSCVRRRSTPRLHLVPEVIGHRRRGHAARL